MAALLKHNGATMIGFKNTLVEKIFAESYHIQQKICC